HADQAAARARRQDRPVAEAAQQHARDDDGEEGGEELRAHHHAHLFDVDGEARAEERERRSVERLQRPEEEEDREADQQQGAVARREEGVGGRHVLERYRARSGCGGHAWRPLYLSFGSTRRRLKWQTASNAS